MSKQQTKQMPGARTAGITTVLLLLLACAGCAVFFVMTDYLPLLLAAILQALPALSNLLLICFRPGEKPPTQKKLLPDEEAADAEAKPVRGIKRFAAFCRRQGVRAWNALRRSGGSILIGAILVLIVGAAVLFFTMQGRSVTVFGLGYHLPALTLALFVLFLILEKWCKHAGDNGRGEEQDGVDPYDRAVLHSLRGALTAGRWAQLVLTVALIAHLMGYAKLMRVATVLILLLFLYEVVFLLISLFVRILRREMATAPELSIPMPGIGSEDLGVISYLEKNTGITMRSLWSIRLIKRIVPYTAIAIVLLLWGFSGLVRIEEYQQGAHYRLGKMQEEALEPGLHLTLPWPFDEVEVYDTEVINTMTVGYVSNGSEDNIWTQSHGTEEHMLLLGGGNELVSLNLRVSYRIDDLHAYLSHASSPEKLLEATAYDTATHRTIRTDLNELLAADRVVFAEEFKADLTERLAVYDTGLTVVDVVLESIHPPVEISDVFQALISAEIDAERIRLEAEGLANALLIEAESIKYLREGQAKAEQLTALAAANAAVEEFRAACEIEQGWQQQGYDYKYHRYLQAISKAYADGRVVIVGENVDKSNIYIGNVPISGG